MIKCDGYLYRVDKESPPCSNYATRFLTSKIANHITAWCDKCYLAVTNNQFTIDNTEEISMERYQACLLLK